MAHLEKGIKADKQSWVYIQGCVFKAAHSRKRIQEFTLKCFQIDNIHFFQYVHT